MVNSSSMSFFSRHDQLTLPVMQLLHISQILGCFLESGLQKRILLCDVEENVITFISKSSSDFTGCLSLDYNLFSFCVKQLPDSPWVSVMPDSPWVSVILHFQSLFRCIAIMLAWKKFICSLI